MDSCYTLKNCTVLTVDETDSFYENGVIVVENGIISELGAAGEVIPRGESVDMGGKLVMPGLINTHTHSHSSIFKNQADDLKLMDWLNKAMWPMEKRLSAKRSRAATSLSCLEYISGGITCIADQFYYAMETAEAEQESGLRSFLAATVFTNPSPETDDTLAAAAAFVERYAGRQDETLIYPCIGPHAPYSVSEALWRECVKLSEKYDLIIHTHISETQDENDQIMAQTGMSPTAWLERMGVLDRRVLAAHSVHLSDADIGIYERKNVCATYNPVSNLKLASGMMPMKKLRDKGVLVSIGTDGAQSNNSMDLLRDLRTGVLIQKQYNDDATFLTAREAVRMATIDGARTLGMQQQIGSLEKGKKADIIALDTESPRLCPLHRGSINNLYATVTYSACGADVTDTIVNGRWLMKNREILTLDAKKVRARAQEASEYLINK